MAIAPVVILGRDDVYEHWVAYREEEPSFGGVQDIADAFMACATRDSDLIVDDSVYDEMVAHGDAPPERPRWALRPLD